MQEVLRGGVTPTYGHYAAHLAPVLARLPELPADMAIVAGYPDVVRARQTHRRIVLMQHGAGQSYSDDNPHYPGGRDNDAVGLFLTPNEHSADRWRRAYPKASVAMVGCPFLDDIPAREPGPQTVAVTFHWNGFRLNEMRNAFPWYRGSIVQLAKAFKVIGHGHPRNRRLPRFYAKHGIEWVPSFEDVCRRADVLLFDNTSAGFMFAATGRPVVVLNAPVYRRDVNHGLRFWDAADVGVQVDEPDDLRAAVELALADPPARQADRAEALSLVFSHRGSSADRAAEAVRSWLQ